MKKLSLPTRDAPVFFRQQDDYSCGPACMQTVANIYGVTDTNYEALRMEMATDPQIGTQADMMAKAAQKYLPFLHCGEHTYAGGIGVALIFDQDEDHYVVLLGQNGQRVLYYDPYDHVLVDIDIHDIDWRARTMDYTHFTIDFKPAHLDVLNDWKQGTLEEAKETPDERHFLEKAKSI